MDGPSSPPRSGPCIPHPRPRVNPRLAQGAPRGQAAGTAASPSGLCASASGSCRRDEIRITVGNTAPKVTIDTRVDGDFFEWGQTIPFSVTVVDPEDGAIDCGAVEVSLVLVHDSHGHGESTVTGCSGSLPTAADLAFHGGYLAAGISVSYTDRGGGGQPPLSATEQHVVQTRRQQVEFS